MWTGTEEPNGVHGNYQLVFQTVGGVPGTPVQIRFFNYPISENREDLHEGGFFVQDKWQLARHLTVNVGLRFDDFATFIPVQSKPAGTFGPPWVAPGLGEEHSDDDDRCIEDVFVRFLQVVRHQFRDSRAPSQQEGGCERCCN